MMVLLAGIAFIQVVLYIVMEHKQQFVQNEILE